MMVIMKTIGLQRVSADSDAIVQNEFEGITDIERTLIRAF